jgi:hypothetical protein
LLGVVGLGLGCWIPGRSISRPGGDAAEVLAMIGMTDELGELVEKRVIALD